MNATKPLCIYHANCADGFGAAWVVRKYFGADGVDFHPASYGSEPPDVTGRDVIIVDFSYKRPVLEVMAATARSILVLDHHKTAASDLGWIARPPETGWDSFVSLIAKDNRADIPFENRLRAIFDMDRSGARLAWNFFFPDDPIPALLRFIEDRDLWRFKYGEATREICAAVYSYPYDFEQWDYLVKSAEEIADGNAELLVEGEAILRQQRKNIVEHIKSSAHRLVIAGHDVPALNCPGFMASDAGHILCEGESFAATYYDTGTHRQFSLRSAPDGADVAALAQQYGGGGHQHAAGFRVDRPRPSPGETREFMDMCLELALAAPLPDAARASETTTLYVDQWGDWWLTAVAAARASETTPLYDPTDENAAVRMVLAAGARHGYGTLIAPLRHAWALMLMQQYSLDEKTAIAATIVEPWPLPEPPA